LVNLALKGADILEKEHFTQKINNVLRKDKMDNNNFIIK